MTNMMTKKEKPRDVAMALQVPAINNRIEEVMGKRAPQFCSALIQVSKQKHIAGCEPFTVIGAAMTAASMDLSIDPNLGFAHIVPYNSRDGKQAQFQMGYKGFIQLGLRTGQYAAMNDFAVNKEAFVSFNPVTGDLVLDSEKLDESGEIVGYGFYFRLVNGFEKTVYWPKEKIEAHAKRFSKSYSKGYGPWTEMFDAMARKTVIKLTLGKYGILSTEMQQAVTMDQAVVSNDGESDMVYADNETTASGPVYDEPAIPETDEPKEEQPPAAEEEQQQEEPPKEDDQKQEESVSLTPVEDLGKTEIDAELKNHMNESYFSAVAKPHMLGDDENYLKYPISAKRDLLTDLRAAVENQA